MTSLVRVPSASARRSIFLGRDIGEQRNYSDEVARMIDDEVRAIIDKAYARATEVLTTYQDRLTQLAETLVAKETIEADEFEAMFADLPEPRNEPGGSPTPKLALAAHAPTPGGRRRRGQPGRRSAAADPSRGTGARTPAGLIGPRTRHATHPGEGSHDAHRGRRGLSAGAC